jgi:hypothetical protein
MAAGIVPKNETGKTVSPCRFGDEEMLVNVHYMVAIYGCIPAFTLGKLKHSLAVPFK